MVGNQVAVRGVTFRGKDTLRVAAAVAAGGAVEARLTPVSDNQYDANAVQIDANVGEQWLHVGFLAKELCVPFREQVAVVEETHKVNVDSVPGKIVEAEIDESGKYAGLVCEFNLPDYLPKQRAVNQEAIARAVIARLDAAAEEYLSDCGDLGTRYGI